MIKLCLILSIFSTSVYSETLFKEHRYTGPIPPNPYIPHRVPYNQALSGYRYGGYAGYPNYVARAPRSYTYIPGYGLVPNE